MPGNAVRSIATTMHRVGAGGPVLVVLDGPEYVKRTGLVRLLRRLHATGAVPPHDVALVVPDDRMETYSAQPAFAAALVQALDDRVGRRRGRRVGLGASLGALALLHAHRADRRAFAGLFLQSGSFFRMQTDAQEARFARFGRIDRFVGGVLAAQQAERAVPTVITCGLDEENYANNARVAQALAAQAYPVEFHAARGGHDWPTWRRAIVAHLPALLRRAWA